MTLTLVPVDLRTANDFVAVWHRHLNGTQQCWACGGPSGDDLGTGCGECDGTGGCFACYEGMVTDA